MVCFLQVLFRFVFNLPLAWTEELSRYVFIILIYCGASAAVLDNAHVRVELIDNVLSERGRFALDIAVKLLCAAVSLVIAYNSRQIIYNASLSKQPVRLSQNSYGRPVCTGCCHVLPDCLQIPAGSV